MSQGCQGEGHNLVRRAEFAELLTEARAVTWIHGDDLDAHSVIRKATHDGATANLAYRHVEEDLHRATQRDFFFGFNVEPAEREILHVANIAMSSGLPSDNNSPGRPDARVLPLFLMPHWRSKEENCWVKEV